MAEEKDKRTCQICGRLIGAKKGTIAHHGYRVINGGMGGWFSGSCDGTHHLPFEKSRDLLGEHLVRCRSMLAGKKARLKMLQEDHPEVVIVKTLRTNITQRNSEKDFHLTKANFEETVAENVDIFRRYSGCSRWEDILRTEVRRAENDVNGFTSYLEHQQTRYDGWVQKEAA